MERTIGITGQRSGAGLVASARVCPLSDVVARANTSAAVSRPRPPKGTQPARALPGTMAGRGTTTPIATIGSYRFTAESLATQHVASDWSLKQQVGSSK